MDHNQAVNRGGASEFFQAWKNKEKKVLLWKQRVKNYTPQLPRSFWENNNPCICIMEHVTHFRTLIVILHMNKGLQAIYCNPKLHIRQQWLFADIILKTRSKFSLCLFSVGRVQVQVVTLCVVHWKHFAHINWPVAQVATKQTLW